MSEGELVRFFWLPGEFEGETLIARHAHYLLALADGDVVGVETHDGFALLMDGQHQLLCLGFGLEEDLLEYIDDKLHRGEVIVVHDDVIHARLVDGETLTLIGAGLGLCHGGEMKELKNDRMKKWRGTLWGMSQ